MEEITAEDAGGILNVSAAQVRWYHRNGLLPGRRIGARVLVFRRRDVEKFVKPTKTGRPKASNGKVKKRKGSAQDGK